MNEIEDRYLELLREAPPGKYVSSDLFRRLQDPPVSRNMVNKRMRRISRIVALQGQSGRCGGYRLRP